MCVKHFGVPQDPWVVGSSPHQRCWPYPLAARAARSSRSPGYWSGWPPSSLGRFSRLWRSASSDASRSARSRPLSRSFPGAAARRFRPSTDLVCAKRDPGPRSGRIALAVDWLWSRRSDLNRGPADYESAALPLSYAGIFWQEPVSVKPANVNRSRNDDARSIFAAHADPRVVHFARTSTDFTTDVDPKRRGSDEWSARHADCNRSRRKGGASESPTTQAPAGSRRPKSTLSCGRGAVPPQYIVL